MVKDMRVLVTRAYGCLILIVCQSKLRRALLHYLRRSPIFKDGYTYLANESPNDLVSRAANCSRKYVDQYHETLLVIFIRSLGANVNLKAIFGLETIFIFGDARLRA